VGLISAPGGTGNPAPPGSTPASRQFQAEPRGDARVFCAVGGHAAGRLGAALSRRRALNVLVRVAGYFIDMRASLAHGPQGHPPSALGPPNGGLFFLRFSFAAGRRGFL
jgi:hypothetical protein